jgi:hypothetical protein
VGTHLARPTPGLYSKVCDPFGWGDVSRA